MNVLMLLKYFLIAAYLQYYCAASLQRSRYSIVVSPNGEKVGNKMERKSKRNGEKSRNHCDIEQVERRPQHEAERGEANRVVRGARYAAQNSGGRIPKRNEWQQRRRDYHDYAPAVNGDS